MNVDDPAYELNKVGLGTFHLNHAVASPGAYVGVMTKTWTWDQYCADGRSASAGRPVPFEVVQGGDEVTFLLDDLRSRVAIVTPGCLTGYKNCDGLAQTGCETDVLTDPLHCGGCNQQCLGGTACMTNVCIAGQCETVPATDGSSCSDGDPCNGLEICQAGVCEDGTPMACDDGDDCNGVEHCVAGLCEDNTPMACDDGDDCNGVEHCVAGLCEDGTPMACDDGDDCNGVERCVAGVCEDGTPMACDDGNACNGVEHCVAGVCEDGTALICDDDNPCTTDSCDPATGCRHVAVANGTSCADANLCNGAEVCVAGVCEDGTALVCDDDDPCTTDTCDPTTGCVIQPDPACNDDDDKGGSDGCGCAHGGGGQAPNVPFTLAFFALILARIARRGARG